MKKILAKIKKASGTCGNFLVKHDSIIYSACVTSLAFIALGFWMQLSHASRTMEMLGENAKLEIMIERQARELNEISSSLNEAALIIQQQNDQLLRSEKLIQMQHGVIQELIERLKDLGEWPPQPKRIDPNKII